MVMVIIVASFINFVLLVYMWSLLQINIVIIIIISRSIISIIIKAIIDFLGVAVCLRQ